MSYRYIGNKTRTLSHVVRAISNEVESGATVADLMCGTASVSAGLRDAGFHVVASDIMTYACHHATVRLTMGAAPRFLGLGMTYEGVIHKLNALTGIDGHMTQEYSPVGCPKNGSAPRQYLTAENARKIDAINGCLKAWVLDSKITNEENQLLRHDMVLATNRIANIAGTYGHFRSSWSNGSRASFQLIPSKFIAGNSIGHKVLQGPAELIAEGLAADLCYLDPPYMKRQYAANYHLLETIARGDEPEAIGISGLRPWRDQYSDFCSKVRIRSAFSKIIQRMKCKRFVISYSEDGLLEKHQMIELLETFGRTRCVEYVIPRFKSNVGGVGGGVTEYFFVLHLS